MNNIIEKLYKIHEEMSNDVDNINDDFLCERFKKGLLDLSQVIELIEGGNDENN